MGGRELPGQGRLGGMRAPRTRGRRSAAGHAGRYAALLLAVATLAGACTGGPPAPGSSGGPTRSAIGSPTGPGLSSSPSSPTSTPTSSPAQPNPTADSGRLTIALAGDVHFERQVRALLNVPDGLAELRPVLGGADLAIVNLETAITTRGAPEPKAFTFRAAPSALATLAAAGVDVVSMANNHGVDYGPQGLADSLAAQADSPIPVIGIGADAQAAFAPAATTVRGISVAVIASTQIDDLTARKFPATDSSPGVAANLNNARLLRAVAAARTAYDVVVVFLHWGTERTTCPDAAQRATAAALERAGVDVIAGGHHHRVLGAGWLGRSYVAYGLGNFVWWMHTNTPADAASGVLTVSIDEAAVAARRSVPRARWDELSPVVVADSYLPLTISAQDGIPRPAAQAPLRLAAWEAARACTNLRGNP